MRIVVDANVLISGTFFSGPPSRILDACFSGRVQLVVSPEILAEYARVGSEFSGRRTDADFERFLALLLSASLLVEGTSGSSPICVDADDDKFFHCALAGGATHIVSGDRHLLDVSGHGGIEVVRPRDFLERYIQGKT